MNTNEFTLNLNPIKNETVAWVVASRFWTARTLSILWSLVLSWRPQTDFFWPWQAIKHRHQPNSEARTANSQGLWEKHPASSPNPAILARKKPSQCVHHTEEVLEKRWKTIRWFKISCHNNSNVACDKLLVWISRSKGNMLLAYYGETISHPIEHRVMLIKIPATLWLSWFAWAMEKVSL